MSKQKSYTITDIAREIAEETKLHNKALGVTTKAVNAIIRMFINKVEEKIIEEGAQIKIPKFGKFYPREYRRKTVKTPLTGGVQKVKPYRTIGFKASRVLRKYL